MIISDYIIDFKYDDEIVFYSTLSGSFIKMNKKKGSAFLSSNFNVFTKEEISNLARLGFIHDKTINEFNLINKKRKERFENSDKDKAHFTIMTTSACNARCPYCYEKGIHFQNMSDKIAEQVAVFLTKKSNGKPIHISWFGGEPLLNKRIINIITDKLSSNNVSYTSSMISNGFFAKNITLEEIKQWKLSYIQITIDDIGDKYNTIKNYINCEKNAFDEVINGIKHLISNNVKVSIRLNFDPEDISNTLSLIDWIYKKFGPNENLMVYVANIIEDGIKLPTNLKTNPYVPLFEKLCKYGYIKDAKNFKLNPHFLSCSTEYKNYYAITPDGYLSKCEHEVKDKEKTYGSIFTSNTNYDILNKWQNTNIAFEECDKCKCLPICQGGCKAYRFERNDDSFCLPIKNCLSEIAKIYYKCLFNPEITFNDLILYPLSKTKKQIKDYEKYIEGYLKFQEVKSSFTKNKTTLKLDSQFSEALAADVFFFDINHKKGLDGQDSMTNKTYEVKGTGINNDRVKFSKKNKADYVVWVKLKSDTIILTKMNNDIYNSLNSDGYVSLNSYVKSNKDSVLKRIIIKFKHC